MRASILITSNLVQKCKDEKKSENKNPKRFSSMKYYDAIKVQGVEN